MYNLERRKTATCLFQCIIFWRGNFFLLKFLVSTAVLPVIEQPNFELKKRIEKKTVPFLLVIEKSSKFMCKQF